MKHKCLDVAENTITGSIFSVLVSDLSGLLLLRPMALACYSIAACTWTSPPGPSTGGETHVHAATLHERPDSAL